MLENILLILLKQFCWCVILHTDFKGNEPEITTVLMFASFVDVWDAIVLQNLRSGTTCVTMLMRGSTLHISWLGDSQAILVKNGKVVNIMEPHKPEREVGHCTVQVDWNPRERWVIVQYR